MRPKRNRYAIMSSTNAIYDDWAKLSEKNAKEKKSSSKRPSYPRKTRP